MEHDILVHLLWRAYDGTEFVSAGQIWRMRLGTRCKPRSQKIQFFFFFLLKFNMVCTFWIVLMCWCQKWFLKNKKTSLACISAQKVIWKATATTLPSTLELYLIKIDLFGTSYSSFHSNFENRIPFLLLGLLLPHLALFFLLLEMNSMGSSADLVAP